ncbi:MAG: RDD family protein [Bryobacteraceae bacterium]
MTCQHCQTWILDDDHRCRRCGRRVRNTPSRVSPATFPIAASALAHDIFKDAPPEESAPEARVDADGQQILFPGTAPDIRVIPFDSLTSQAERDSIRARAAGISRPAPLKSEKVQLKHAKAAKKRTADQRRLEFQGEAEVVAPPQSHIICDAPVAPLSLRLEAALVDGVLMLCGVAFTFGVLRFAGMAFDWDKHNVAFLLLGLLTVPLFYKVLWTIAGVDTIGMKSAGLQLIDFDGNPPSSARRYQRLGGSIISFLAAGVGLIWSLVDEDRLTWQDHISSTFPTIPGTD